MIRSTTRRLAAALLPLALATVAASCREAAGTSTLPSTTVPKDGGFVLRTVVDGGVAYRYQVFMPRGFDRARRLPVILFLHGAGQMGSDGAQQTHDGLGSVVRVRRTTFPAIVVFPQSPRAERGVGRAIFARIAMRALDQTVTEFGGDTARVYLTGYSMGAKLGYELIAEHAGRFAAFVPIAGDICVPCVTGRRDAPEDSTYRAVLGEMGAVPMWIFHGRADPTVPVAGARRIVEIRRSTGAPVRYTEFPAGGHAVWADAFATPALLPWLFAQHH